MNSLVLIFNPAGDATRNTRISSSLKELCHNWVALCDNNDATINQISHAMEGVNGESLKLSSISPDERKDKLDQLLRGKASHLMVLQPGNAVECDVKFHPTPDNKPEQVLHLSPSRDIGYWKSLIIPNSPEYWKLEDGCRVVTTQQQDARRNHHIRVLDHKHFLRRRSLDQVTIKTLIQKHEDSPDAGSAMRIAEGLYKRKDYYQAKDWFPVVLKHTASTPVHWLAHFRSAQCHAQLETRWADVEVHYASAFDLDPNRMEPLYYLIKHYREAGDYTRACDLADIATHIKEPVEGIEFEPDIYRHRLATEHATCLLELKHDARCISLINDTLHTQGIPEQVRRELAGLRARAYERICPVYPVSIHLKNRLLIVIAFRNAGEFLGKCVSSIQHQTYPNYRVVLVDDASTDGALPAIGKLGEHFITIVNDQRMGALHNQLKAIREFASEGDIVVHLDGDDWLAHDDVLTRINDFFNRTRCWLMYSQFENSLGEYGSCEPLVPDGEPLLDQLTKMHFPMHIRAYRAGVLFELMKQDPALEVLKDNEGTFLDAISDLALMRALIQVAGTYNTRYNEEILYIYNRSNPESHYQTREAMTLQQKLSEIAAEKPPLKLADHYQQSNHTPETDGKATTLFLALDGATPDLIEQWAADGHLPNLARILEKCPSRQIRCPDSFGNDVFWTSVFTGCLPDETGYFFRVKLLPVNYSLERQGPAQQVKQDSFWTTLVDTDAELAIIDMPEIKHGGVINGLEISEWLPHARCSQFHAFPVKLKQDVLDRFGDDPLDGTTERSTPRSEPETERDINLLLQSVKQETRAAAHYLDRGGWDFFAVGYGQAHDAGHQFWHLHDPGHSRYSKHWHEKHGDPLLQVYQHIDTGIGELMDKAGGNAQLILMAGLSMQSKTSCNSILDQILWEIDIYDRRKSDEAYPKQNDLDQRRFFMVPHNNLSGAIRFNLAGRESRGVVTEDQEYEDTIDLLKQRLSQVINSETSEPVISLIVPIRETYSGNQVNDLPDLMVVWNRKQTIREVSSPYFAPIRVRIREKLDARSGDHTGHATLYSNIESMIEGAGELNSENIYTRLIDLIKAS